MMKKIRVAQVTLSMGQGGIENLLVALVKNSNTACYRTFLYCLDTGGELLPFIESFGVQTKVLGRQPGLDLRLIFCLARLFRDDGIDVVHTHNEAAHFYGCLAARLARKPVIINTEHSRHYVDGHWRRRFEKRFISWLTQMNVAVSEELRSASIDQDGLPSKKVRVISNGVDYKRYQSTSREDASQLIETLSLPKHSKLIAIVARLTPIKNHVLLLNAFAILLNKHPDFHLLVIGDGELRSSLEELTCQLEIQVNVTFLGNRLDVPMLLKAFDALVLCSKREGLPMVLLEGMAAGVPLVVTKSANGSLIVRHRNTGFVSENNAQNLAGTLIDALTCEESKCFVENAKVMVHEKYSIQNTVALYEALYQEILTQESIDV